MPAESRRKLQLDVLRGAAILLVFGRHLQVSRPDGVLGVFAEAWFRVGWLGVDLFFVLSGFLIGGLLLSELDRHGTIDVPRFLVRRGLKIYPPYFAFLAYLFAMPAAKALARGDGVAGAGSTLAGQWHDLWPNILFLQNYVGRNPEGHTWSLAVEEHFYLVLPFVLAVLAMAGRARHTALLCVAAVPLCLGLRCASVWSGDPYAVKMAATHLRLDALLFGVALRGVAQYMPARFLAARRWRAPLVAVCLCCWLPHLFVDPASALNRTVGLTATFLGAAALLVAVYHTHEADTGRWASLVTPLASLLAWVGVYSYAIYLWHITAMRVLERVVGSRLSAAAGEATPLGWLATVLVVSGGAIAVGVVASKVVEWPVLRLRDRFFPSRSGALPPAAPTVNPSVSPPFSGDGRASRRATCGSW